MLKTTTAALALFAALAAPALALTTPYPVSDVEVTTNIEGVEVGDVTEYYPAFNDDLARAIWDRVENPMTDGSNGFEIDVKVTSLQLDGGPMGAQGEFNQIEGIAVYTFHGADNPAGTFPIAVNARAGDSVAGAVNLMPGEGDYYVAMLDAFAQGVQNKLADLPAPEPEANMSDN
ncbi:hypothetical protein [Pseudooceanicola aestuarii]|uniref:hypothetical protein n=1 Tax=Pseudooceanicola aestuarii TaxID=2697319 RepID=UPI0013D7EEE6|nr:hypothetical protein [Pseudooceanicola aestuarii]